MKVIRRGFDVISVTSGNQTENLIYHPIVIKPTFCLGCHFVSVQVLTEAKICAVTARQSRAFLPLTDKFPLVISSIETLFLCHVKLEGGFANPTLHNERRGCFV